MPKITHFGGGFERPHANTHQSAALEALFQSIGTIAAIRERSQAIEREDQLRREFEQRQQQERAQLASLRAGAFAQPTVTDLGFGPGGVPTPTAVEERTFGIPTEELAQRLGELSPQAQEIAMRDLMAGEQRQALQRAVTSVASRAKRTLDAGLLNDEESAFMGELQQKAGMAQSPEELSGIEERMFAIQQRARGRRMREDRAGHVARLRDKEQVGTQRWEILHALEDTVATDPELTGRQFAQILFDLENPRDDRLPTFGEYYLQRKRQFDGEDMSVDELRQEYAEVFQQIVAPPAAAAGPPAPAQQGPSPAGAPASAAAQLLQAATQQAQGDLDRKAEGKSRVMSEGESMEKLGKALEGASTDNERQELLSQFGLWSKDPEQRKATIEQAQAAWEKAKPKRRGARKGRPVSRDLLDSLQGGP